MIDWKKETLISLREAAERLNCDLRTVRRWAAYGHDGKRLETIRAGRLLRTSIQAIDRFVSHDGFTSLPRLTPSQQQNQRAKADLAKRHGKPQSHTVRE